MFHLRPVPRYGRWILTKVTTKVRRGNAISVVGSTRDGKIDGAFHRMSKVEATLKIAERYVIRCRWWCAVLRGRDADSSGMYEGSRLLALRIILRRRAT